MVIMSLELIPYIIEHNLFHVNIKNPLNDISKFSESVFRLFDVSFLLKICTFISLVNCQLFGRKDRKSPFTYAIIYWANASMVPGHFLRTQRKLFLFSLFTMTDFFWRTATRPGKGFQKMGGWHVTYDPGIV